MRFNYAHDESSKGAVFCSVEQQDTTETLAIGTIMVWSVTNNAAVAGIMANTFGYRVIIQPATASLVNVAGVVASLPTFNGTTANKAAAARVPPFEIQVYGHCQANVNVDSDSTAPFPLKTAATANTLMQGALGTDDGSWIGFGFLTQTAVAGADADADIFLRLM